METSNPQKISRRLYVGGLSYSVDDEELRALFEPFGKVDSVASPKDPIGYVEMATMEDAKEAIEKLNGSR
ncbi:RNA-binding protein 39 [Beauveria bassiana ARSEF 2860]|uniref:RNA-binding protein 39 n=1 Tax=Beauveria bassiana (strain ARSEF 2860) TaxID=655819 RepID=J4KN35_BEAB2|nr:RNA-binding protein 39 [Beauveria bassiana ARSEF 2860]EJP65014.1 RNA-binding protein 39 [Beauveria bassiana ARSEF 2860]